MYVAKHMRSTTDYAYTWIATAWSGNAHRQILLMCTGLEVKLKVTNVYTLGSDRPGDSLNYIRTSTCTLFSMYSTYIYM